MERVREEAMREREQRERQHREEVEAYLDQVRSVEMEGKRRIKDTRDRHKREIAEMHGEYQRHLGEKLSQM